MSIILSLYMIDFIMTISNLKIVKNATVVILL